MKRGKTLLGLLVIGVLVAYAFQQKVPKDVLSPNFITHISDTKKNDIRFYHKDAEGNAFRNHGRLLKHIEDVGGNLNFAMNGGMYQKDLTPLGLYIENGEEVKRVNKVKEAHGNFYMQPNGIFYLNKDKLAQVVVTTDFKMNDEVEYATQSGPMLVVDGNIHANFREGSSNVHIRNGVGILPDGRVLFAMSKSKVNFYDFASFFLQQGCENALYLDGYVSRTYAPDQYWEQLDGKFGVIIAEVEGNL